MLRQGGVPLAVHRDHRGARPLGGVHPPRLPRPGCDEESWDCPCHGSRFAPTGEVLTAPAVRALEPAEERVEEKVVR